MSLVALADPPAVYVDGAAMDCLVIEAVSALRASSAVAAARATKIELEMAQAGFVPPPPVAKPQHSSKDSVGSNTARPHSYVDEEDEGVRSRLEAIGLHVGANYAEKLCRDRPLFSDSLDAIKFICKELWVSCWDKQVDNLRTNHRGVFVLQDNTFKPLTRISSWEGRAETLKRAKLAAAFPAGIIRGALSRMGLHGTVTPEITAPPHCTFQIKLPKNT
ncbi:NO signaling/Golgi transport ligand-binding domain-containing protein [Pisolithus orientalis]|uniref:NO signaling/Golgi transport ligand-binding domain-containing protein n=1 Tax=Pisolithus orientalis TaxID=936130 RepID=UPI0022256942|nr:NO signaling/Golgi transport ligand-binding domain-containing protein [Pisolithus orientalis]KAI5997856.1 NO signaling/Golgi transport ligand-binding domain-containing protein [Pisolithus orientalis]KAI6153102.1 NO signaling/Golgi transport ligand-binding domain-containing protein [Pisolithus tinctorius]